MPIYTDHVQKGASPSGTKISVVAGGRGYRIFLQKMAAQKNFRQCHLQFIMVNLEFAILA